MSTENILTVQVVAKSILCLLPKIPPRPEQLMQSLHSPFVSISQSPENFPAEKSPPDSPLQGKFSRVSSLAGKEMCLTR